jgi:hypothetical protein
MVMNTEEGIFITEEKAEQIDPMKLEHFEHGETVQIKEGFFQVCRVDLRRQRLILKPIPSPLDQQIDDRLQALARGASCAR